MASLKIGRKYFISCVQRSIKFSISRSVTMANIRILHEKGVLSLSCNTSEYGIIIHCYPEEWEGENITVLVSAQRLLECLSQYDGEFIDLKLENEKITVKSGKSKSQIKTSEEFLDFTEIPESIKFDGSLDQLRNVAICALRNDNVSDIFSCINLSYDGELFTMMSADRTRAAIYSQKCDCGEEFSVSVRSTSISPRLPDKINGISVFNGKVWFFSEDQICYFVIQDESYPNIRLLKSEIIGHVTVQPALLTEALKRAAIVGDEYHSCILEFNKKSMRVIADGGIHSTTTEIEVNGDFEHRIGVNSILMQQITGVFSNAVHVYVPSDGVMFIRGEKNRPQYILAPMKRDNYKYQEEVAKQPDGDEFAEE